MLGNRAVLRSLRAAAIVFLLVLGGNANGAILQELQFQGHTYYLLASKWWHESEDEAAALGGHLVTVNSAAEHDFVYNNFGPTAIANAPASGKVNLWIGLCDPLMDQNLQWCDNAPTDYLNFFSDQPQRNYNDEMFVGIRVRGRNSSVLVGKWIDIVSDPRLGDLNFGVVEVVPEPAASVFAILSVPAIAYARCRRAKRAASAPLRLKGLT